MARTIVGTFPPPVPALALNVGLIVPSVISAFGSVLATQKGTTAAVLPGSVVMVGDLFSSHPSPPALAPLLGLNPLTMSGTLPPPVPILALRVCTV